MSTAIGQQLLDQSYQDGEISAARQSIMVFLRARFGSLPAGLEAQLAEIDSLSRLTALQERAAIVPSLDGFLDALKETQAR